jgi:hypothetical protein
MKNLFIAILCFMSMAVFASENKDPNQTLFQSAECFGKQGYCEFVDFRGNSSEPAFEEMPAIIDFYTGPTGVNGITCNEWDAVCKNGNSEVMGLNPNFKDDNGNSFKGKSAGSSQPAQQPVQQAAELPYKITVEDVYPYGINNPLKMRAVKIVSIVSSLTVNKVTVNEGGCMLSSSNGDNAGTSKQLSMGRDLTVKYFDGCTVVKIVVETNQGSWTHTL